MEFVLIILLIVIIAWITPKPVDLTDKPNFVVQKQCPPHQWVWQDQLNINGAKCGERIVCKICGPIKLQQGQDR